MHIEWQNVNFSTSVAGSLICQWRHEKIMNEYSERISCQCTKVNERNGESLDCMIQHSKTLLFEERSESDANWQFFCQEEFLHLTGDGLTCFLLVQEFTYLWREMISRDFTRWRIKIWGKVFCWMYQFHGFYCKVHGNILYTEWITLFEPNFSLIIYWGQAKNRFLKLNLFFPSMWN